jgi:hypothetical protein
MATNNDIGYFKKFIPNTNTEVLIKQRHITYSVGGRWPDIGYFKKFIPNTNTEVLIKQRHITYSVGGRWPAMQCGTSMNSINRT